jgi:hypothetical protein
MTAASIGIEQINLSFHEAEDRLLLKMGLLDKTEIAVWLTRRIVKAVWGLLQSSAHTNSPPAKLAETQLLTANKVEALADFARTAKTQHTLEHMDFIKAYEDHRVKLTETPLLVIQAILIALESHHDVNTTGYLELHCHNGQAIKIALNPEITHAMLSMMQLTTREAGWDLVLNVDAVGFNVEPTKAYLH